MRFGVDACCWSNRRGFGRFTRELLTHMVAGFPGHEFVLLSDRRTAESAQFPSGAQVTIVDTSEQPTQAAAAHGSRSLLDLWRMSRAAARLAVDAFFFPAVYSYFPLLRRMPAAITFHDAIAERLPKLVFPGRRSRWLWQAKSWLARRQADRIVTVSQDARTQVAETFGVAAAQITVVGEGAGEGFRPLADATATRRVLARHALPEGPLILYVGGLSPHKNLQGLLRALVGLVDVSWHAALVGDHTSDVFHGCYAELRALTETLGLRDRVTFTGHVSQDDLVALYNAATLLVLPSLSEGFGLPVVEAMACGLPVAASRAGSLPEVVGSAGLLFDPTDPADLASTLRRLLGDVSLRQRLRSEGLRQAGRYSWHASAGAVVRLLEEMVDASRAAA